LAYERNYATSKDPVDFAKAITLTNKVLHDIYPGVKNADTAFAFSIQGLVQNNAGQMAAAEFSFKQALMIYDSLPNSMNEIAARAKNKYAAILLTRTDKEKEAEAILRLEQAKAFWMAQENFYQTPYAARNFITLGKAYLKAGNAQGACNEVNRALPIYKSIYGTNNAMLAQPYKLLTICYAKIGDTKMSETYKSRLAELK
jgi:Tfp pilus assembly protein PilF